MRINGYQCDGCGTVAKGRQGDQRDPGPFLPKRWSGGGHLCFCPKCAEAIKAGALK